MTDERARGISAILPWLPTIIAAGAVVYGYGIQTQRIDRLENDVKEMRADARSNATTLSEIKDTVTVVRTKLEVLLPTEPRKERN